MKKYSINSKALALLASSMLVLAPITSLHATTYDGGNQSALSTTNANVSIYDNYFTPNSVTISQGATVTWMNMGTSAHTVTSDNNMFNSGTLTPNSSFSVTFNTPGTYYYHCNFHPGMTGVVIVQSGGSPNNTLVGTVGSSSSTGGTIIINQITASKTSGVADNTFNNGWRWVFDITVPYNETNLAMKFDNWLMNNGATIIPAANNMRFYSTQSSNANSQNNAIYITSPAAYSGNMILNGNLDNSTNSRRVQIIVETKIPTGTPNGSYSTIFGIRTQ